MSKPLIAVTRRLPPACETRLAADYSVRPGADDRSIAVSLGISRGDVEVIFRHLQHGTANFAQSEL